MATATTNEATGRIVYDTESVRASIKDAITTTCDQGEKISAQGIKTVSFSLIPALFGLFSSALEYLGLSSSISEPISGIFAERVTACAAPVVDTSVKATCGITKQVLHTSAEKTIDSSARSWSRVF